TFSTEGDPVPIRIEIRGSDDDSSGGEASTPDWKVEPAPGGCGLPTRTNAAASGDPLGPIVIVFEKPPGTTISWLPDSSTRAIAKSGLSGTALRISPARTAGASYSASGVAVGRFGVTVLLTPPMAMSM